MKDRREKKQAECLLCGDQRERQGLHSYGAIFQTALRKKELVDREGKNAPANMGIFERN